MIETVTKLERLGAYLHQNKPEKQEPRQQELTNLDKLILRSRMAQNEESSNQKRIITVDNTQLEVVNKSQRLDGGTVIVQPSSRTLFLPGSVSKPIYPQGLLYDHQTANKSFIRVHKQLKKLGIKNNEFFLLLINPRLKNVDPYDPNITPQEAMWVIQECQYNFFYFLREVVRIPQQGAGIVPFELDRGTLAAAYCFINDINLYMIKPRQTGKSVGICAFLAWAFKFGITNGGFAFYANKEKNSKANLKRMKTYLQLLPYYMANMGTQVRDSAGKLVRKTNNITRYYEPASGNTADVMNCAISEETAEELGRGDSHNFEFYDESEFTTCIETTVQVSGMAFNTASYNAIKNGMHSCRIFTTTPGDLSNEKKCGSAMKLVNDAVPWSEHFYDVNPLQLKRMIVNKSNYRIVYIIYNYKQLGLGEAWFRRACSMVGNNISKIRREILLERFAGNNDSPFNEDEITELNEGITSPVKTVKFGRGGLYELKFYLPEEEIKRNRVYFIGLDPSDGTGSDNYGLTVIDPYNFKVIMEFKSAYMSPQGCKELLQYIVEKWFTKAILCVENNRNGLTLIDYLKESKLRQRLYVSSEASSDNLLVRTKYDNIGFIKNELMKRKYAGIHTSQTTRDMMMSLLVDAVHFRKDILTSEYLVEDINNLVLKNGKIQAAAGKHDDIVMSWCIAMYTIYYGERLERYGFTKGSIPNDMIESKEYDDLEELYKSPYIRKNFQSFTSFYDAITRGKMEQSLQEQKAKTMQEVVDDQMGSISGDITKMDPEYGKKPYYRQEDSSSNLMDRFNRLNAGRGSYQFTKPSDGEYRRSRRTDPDDDKSWI